MDEANVRNLLAGLQINLSKVSYTGSLKRTLWMQVGCPFAHWTHAKSTDLNPSFGITIKPDGRSAYKCLSCNLKGSLASLPSRLGGYREKNYSKLRHWAELVEIESKTHKLLPKWEDADPVSLDYEERNASTNKLHAPKSAERSGFPRIYGHAYLRDRGITFPYPLCLELRWDQWQQRILFPCYDRDDTFVGFTGRSVREGNVSTKGRDPKVKDYFGLPKREIFLRLRRDRLFGNRLFGTRGPGSDTDGTDCSGIHGTEHAIRGTAADRPRTLHIKPTKDARISKGRKRGPTNPRRLHKTLSNTQRIQREDGIGKVEFHGVPEKQPATSPLPQPTRLLDLRKIIVEGLFDFGNMISHGYFNTHAILGTALTEEKINILIEEGDPVYFFMDDDLAGWQALFGTQDKDGNLETDNAWAYKLYKEIPVWIVPYPKTFSEDKLDPGKLSAKQIKRMLSKAWLFMGKAPLNSFDEPVWRSVKNP